MSSQEERIEQLKQFGHDNIHMMVLNMQHAYTMWLNAQDNNQRRSLWRTIHLMSLDIAAITQNMCPDLEATIYKQLAGEI